MQSKNVGRHLAKDRLVNKSLYDGVTSLLPTARLIHGPFVVEHSVYHINPQNFSTLLSLSQVFLYTLRGYLK